MAKKTVGRTALGAATCRLMEQYQPEPVRLFDDPVVHTLVGSTVQFISRFASMRNFTINQMDSITKGIYGSQVCRTRYIDDAVIAAFAGGIDQLVILGAGFDTRAFRLPGNKQVEVYEVDLPSVQNEKKQKLQKAFGRLPEHVTFIPIDFDKQPMESVFAETTYDPSRPAVFVWEAVTQYITAEAVRQTLSFVGKSAAGSVLLFTYVLKSVIDRRSDIPGADQLMDFVANDSPWMFGLEPAELASFLKPFGLTLAEDVGNAYYQEKYLQLSGRQLVVSEIERVARAVIE